MHLYPIDLVIILAYVATALWVGYRVSHLASKDMRSYFLGGNALPWYILGISNASGMFDIGGTMLLATWLFTYGLKSVWIPWLWPTFNQVFLMVYLSKWLRRSNVMTGAEWIKTRFGDTRGARLSHIIVVIYALVSVVGFLTYAFKAIGKFATQFLPWHLTANEYALILIAITAFYVVKGGMFSVVITEVIQFCILSVASLAIGVIAMLRVSPETLHKFVPAGWDNIFFGWHLNLNWAPLLPSADVQIRQDGYELFGLFVMMLLFKGVLVSMAGPAPNYDMQRILSTKNQREASLMSAWVNVVLTVPRYFLIAGLTVLALVLYAGKLPLSDLELVLPNVLGTYVPMGLRGFLVAGLLAAFMSNFAATVNAAPPYIVNDIYKRFINPDASARSYVRLSYLSSFAVVVLGICFGWFVASINSVVVWIVSALWGGYTASNVLKWYWWRFNGHGYFWGMVSGIGGALVVPLVLNLSPIRAFVVSQGFAPNATVLPLYAFPLLLAISLAGCLLGTLFTAPESDAVLVSFYRRVRPWGFWGPVLAKIRQQEPSFEANHDFARDAFNVVVGMIWQLSLVPLPIYIVLKNYRAAAATFAVIVTTSLILKFTWYDHLNREEMLRSGSQNVPEERAEEGSANSAKQEVASRER
jgi:Na+/proline symporter